MTNSVVVSDDRALGADVHHPPMPDLAQMRQEIAEGMADARAGRTVDGQDVLRRIRAKADALRARQHGEAIQKS